MKYETKIKKLKDSKKEAIRILKAGGIGVLPTDTLYGLVGSALKKETVERIYAVKERQETKPCIVLVSEIRDLKYFGILPEKRVVTILKKLWPDKISVLLSCPSEEYAYLHKGTYKIAFRLPKPMWLRKLVQKTGPLVAPSANISGKYPALTIEEAKIYFEEKVDFYVNGGKLESFPSTLVDLYPRQISNEKREH